MENGNVVFIFLVDPIFQRRKPSPPRREIESHATREVEARAESSSWKIPGVKRLFQVSLHHRHE